MDSDLAQLNVSARAILATAKPVLKQLPIQWLVVVVNEVCDVDKNKLFRTDAAHVFTHPRPKAEVHDRPLSEGGLTPIRIRTRDKWSPVATH